MPGFELIGEEEKKSVMDIFDKGGVLYRYGLNAKRQDIFRVDDFEKKIAEKVGAKHALFVCNGTAALKVALVALGVKAGDEVITQSFTFIATVEAILELGAIPVITEIDASLNMDPADLEKKITNKTKVIIPVHMGGVPAKMDEIMAIAKKHDLKVLEDSCQALGATYKGKPLGTIGDIGAYSTDVGKIITTGEGGVMVTNDPALYQKAREYSDHGHECNPDVPRGEDTRSIWGFNYKVTEMQGAVGLAQLKKLDHILDKQRANKKRMKDGISGIKGIEFRELPDAAGDAGDVLIFFVESKQKALDLAGALKADGVGTKNLPDAIDWHYAGTWTQIFGEDHLESRWSQSTDHLRRAIALPVMVNMADEQIDKVVNAVKGAAEKIL
ncbi:MAG: DegT/DnrJ/EryC1/StrS family aminotransferase [Candidatus Margulisiibacteriota bacterium]|nr:DegT/DnrJ/EryC1/StrS family aminotransferase [Candidatus Margulisiibacteriota bacterium]